MIYSLFQGIPNPLRRVVWPQLSEASKLVKKNAGVYSILLDKEAPKDSINLIELDIQRTFPTLSVFQEKSGQQALKNILHSFSVFHPMGYQQGISFIAGVLLTQVEEEVI